MNGQRPERVIAEKPPLEPSEEMRDLLYWLANEDVYTSRYVQQWLERTAPETAADVLAGIADYAQPEPHSYWYMLFRGVSMVMSASETISVKGPAGRKAGTRAALLLAKMNDPRCLPPLVRVFETERFWEGKYQQAVEEALLGFLSGAVEAAVLRPYADVLQRLAERLAPSGSGRRDRSDRFAALLSATRRRLEGEKDNGI